MESFTCILRSIVLDNYALRGEFCGVSNVLNSLVFLVFDFYVNLACRWVCDEKEKAVFHERLKRHHEVMGTCDSACIDGVIQCMY